MDLQDKNTNESTGMLNKLDDRIDKAVALYERKTAEYEKGESLDDEPSRQDVEEAFFQKILWYTDLAKKTGPFSEEGQKDLKEAVNCRRDYEEMMGPLITVVAPENIRLFDKSLTGDLAEDIIYGRAGAIGAFRTVFKTVYGVGVLVYHLDATEDTKEAVVYIDWLYVDSICRKQGVADFLMGELLYRMAEGGLRRVCVSFSKKNKSADLLTYVFEKWKFALSERVSADSIIRIKDIVGFDIMEKNDREVFSLSSVDERERKKLIQRSVRKFGYRGYPSSEKLPTDYFDDGLSCFMGSASDPKGIMLVHKKLSGTYRVDYMSYEEEVPERADMLTAHFLMQAMELEGEPVVWIPYDKRVSEFMYRVCPTQLGSYLISGVLV